MRATLGQLRNETPDESAELRAAGLDRVPALCDAVTAAGAPVTFTTVGQQRPVPPAVSHAAYRILQESLTNVLRHAGPQARAAVCLTYEPGALAIRVADDGNGPGDGGRGPAQRARADRDGRTGRRGRRQFLGGGRVRPAVSWSSRGSPRPGRTEPPRPDRGGQTRRRRHGAAARRAAAAPGAAPVAARDPAR